MKSAVRLLIDFGCLTMTGCVGDSAPLPPRNAPTGSWPPSQGEVVIEELAGRPISVAVQGEPLALAGAGTVARPGGQTLVGRTPLRLAAVPNGVWVSVFGDGRVVLIGFDGVVRVATETINLGTSAEFRSSSDDKLNSRTGGDCCTVR